MAEHLSPQTATALPPTRDIARWIAGTRPGDIDANALRWARHCLLDWLAVTIPGAHDDLVNILIAEARTDGADGPVPIAGRSETVAASWAVLINGTASHALDYDDVNRAMHGHPTVAVMPAVLTEAVTGGHDLERMLQAFVVGYETAALIGDMTGDEHYETGWHNTATIGTFAAAAGVAWLNGLDADRTAHALGSAATMAAGLKSMFGTMCKPLHAGRAAQSGRLAANMAARGWISRDDALECPQGFWATQAPDHAPFAIDRKPGQPFQIENNLFKYHAACYMTHSSIEACRMLAGDKGLTPETISKVRLRVNAGSLKVCNLPEPTTGLEVKFSLKHTAAMALAGVDTAAIANYSNEIANRPDLVTLRRKVEVEALKLDKSVITQADVVIETTDGATLMHGHNVGIPAKDVEVQEQRLSAKFDALVTPILGDAAATAMREDALTGSPAPLALLRATQPQ